MTELAEDEKEPDDTARWYEGLLSAFRRSPDESGEPASDEVSGVKSNHDDSSSRVIDSARASLAKALIAAIRAVSDVRDRDEIVDWLEKAAATLAADKPTTEKAAELYGSVSSRRLAGIVANTEVDPNCWTVGGLG